jgi:hypothetical protein
LGNRLVPGAQGRQHSAQPFLRHLSWVTEQQGRDLYPSRNTDFKGGSFNELLAEGWPDPAHIKLGSEVEPIQASISRRQSIWHGPLPPSPSDILRILTGKEALGPPVYQNPHFQAALLEMLTVIHRTSKDRVKSGVRVPLRVGHDCGPGLGSPGLCFDSSSWASIGHCETWLLTICFLDFFLQESCVS